MNTKILADHDEFKNALDAINRQVSDLQMIDTKHSQKMVIFTVNMLIRAATRIRAAFYLVNTDQNYVKT